MKNNKVVYSKYFNDWEIKPDFNKEFICIFDGWLGEENLHKLDDVTEEQWGKFNQLIQLISYKFELYTVNCEDESINKIVNINEALSTYDESMEKDSSQFTRLIIPELDCILTEEWDYTYILWHRGNEAIDALKPFITKTGLYHFQN